jgi:hypothetical protein
VDGDGAPEIVATGGYRYREGYAYIFQPVSTGKGIGTPPVYEMAWMSNDIGPKPFGLDVDDIDADGIMEIVTGNQPGYIYIFDGVTHDLEWRSDLMGTDVFGIDIVDVDKDGEMEIVAAQGGYIGKSDWTSGYSTPHIYIIDGRTHAIEKALGEPSFVDITFQVAVLVLVVITLLNIGWLMKRRERKRVEATSRRRGVK